MSRNALLPIDISTHNSSRLIQHSKSCSQSSVSFLGTNIDKTGEILLWQNKERDTKYPYVAGVVAYGYFLKLLYAKVIVLSLFELCLPLFSHPLYLAGMLLALLVVVDAHKEDVARVFGNL